VNTVENQYDRLVNRVDVTIENRKKEVLDIMVGASFSNTTTKYKLESQMDQQFLTQQYYTDISVDFAKTWTIGTSFDYNIYSGAAFAEEQTIPLWRASLSKFFLKNQKGQLTLSVFDILNQNQGINRNSELNYIQEERIRAIGRYVMLSFTYSLSGFGNENNGISIETVGRR
jgi:Lhr-like helicase